jgi:hypothetical protein
MVASAWPYTGPATVGLPAIGYFVGSGEFFVGGQLDDYNIGDSPSAGALVSVRPNDAGVDRIPSSQRITVGATDYSAISPLVILTGVVTPGPGTADYSCPVADGGLDGG